MQTKAATDNVTVKRLISFGSPAAIVCVEQVGTSCVDAAVNPYVVRVVTQDLEPITLMPILPTIIGYQGTRDASYQLPIDYDIVRLGEILQLGRTQPNPYLTRLNDWTANCDNQGNNCTSEPGTPSAEISYFNSITTSITGESSVLPWCLSAVGKYLQPKQKSDDLTTLQAACISLELMIVLLHP